MRDWGFTVVEMWEHEWDAMDVTDDTFPQWMKHQKPLNPRDGLFGGRTNAIELYFRCPEGSRVDYVDFTSLYPAVMLSGGAYPVGHPTLIRRDFQFALTEHYYGLNKVKVLPPRHLYIPVLPAHIQNKLMFVLCRTCAEQTKQTGRCRHNAEERALVGTWTTPELKKAVALGYIILDVYEVWHYPQTSTDLFGGTDVGPVGRLSGGLDVGTETDFIREFVSTGPKSYAYVTDQGHTEIKCKGIPLNVTSSGVVNFQSMLRLVEGMEEHRLPNPEPASSHGDASASAYEGKKRERKKKPYKHLTKTRNARTSMLPPSVSDWCKRFRCWTACCGGTVMVVQKRMPPRRRQKTKLKVQQLLHRSYYNPKKAEGYAGYDQLVRQARKQGIRRRQVKEWLEKQPGYTLHKPVQRRFRRSRVVVDGLDERLAGDNQGYKHWLTCVDMLSRYAWVRPLKYKTAPQIIQGFQSIFKESRQPRVLQIDQGTEFLNRHVQAFLKSKGIRHFVTYSDPKP
ncbi:hypothetical protein QZH41_011514 [Actinostola sp. cb2023]|nr:hypothetical protein QZH41_011514 [Actinostola sp. cb2023]